MATLRDIAERAQVSIATVSLYLNGKSKGRISESTMQKIKNAIDELQYQPTKSKALLHHLETEDRQRTIAVYWASDARASLLGKVMAGLQECILKEGMSHLTIIIRPYKINELYKEKELLLPRYYDGVIISNTTSLDMQYLDSVQLPMPAVLLNRRSDRYSTVTLDNRGMGEQIARMMKDRGIPSVAVFRTMNPYLAVNQRLMGFIDGCRAFRIQIPNEAQFIVENSVEGGMEAARRYLTLQQQPKAIFADNDLLAMGALSAFYKQGFRVPEDAALISIGQYAFSSVRCTIPALTTLDVPLQSLAYHCLKLLGELLYTKKSGPLHQQIEPELHMRESFV